MEGFSQTSGSVFTINMSSRGPWVPRVLKKRDAFFAGEDPPAAPPAQVAAGAAAATFGGAADLDDLEEGEPAAKRVRPDGTVTAGGSASPSSASAAAPAAPAPVVDPNRDEVAEAAPRLAQHIASAAKFNKVAAMAWSLLDTCRVTKKNGGAFFAVLEAGISDPSRLRDKTYRVAYLKLYSAAVARAALFPEEKRPLLKLWEVQVLAQAELYTDDSYQFSRAAKVVREALAGLPCVYPSLEPPGAVHLPEAERGVWADALFSCVESAMAHQKYAWAKTTVDMLVKATIDRRTSFSEAQQRSLQEWNLRCKGQKVQRQQEHQQNQKRDLTSYEKKEAEWRSADISLGKGGGDQGGGLDNWAAKQNNN